METVSSILIRPPCHQFIEFKKKNFKLFSLTMPAIYTLDFIGDINRGQRTVFRQNLKYTQQI